MPSANKPSQAYLRGWTTVVRKGNVVAIGDENSPQLNANNSSGDRATVMGNKCLNIQDKKAFTRVVYQRISSTTHVPLPDGRYTMTCYVKSGSAFNTLYMYAKVGSDTARVDMPYSDSKWHKVVMDDVTIQGGSVEVGFFADAPANAWCHIDDVSLIRTGEIGDDLGLYDVDATGVSTAYYSLSGKRLSAPQRGVNVVRKMVNGKIRSYKVVTN